MKENLVRVLNVVPNMKAAGVETFIMNVYRNIDRTKVQFDFLVKKRILWWWNRKTRWKNLQTNL